MAKTLTPKALLTSRWGDPWLWGIDVAQFWRELDQWQTRFSAALVQDVAIATENPISFLSAFFAACQQSCRVWLMNPQWGEQEWQQAAMQVPRPDYVVGQVPLELWPEPPFDFFKKKPAIRLPQTGNPQILIPTGGSSGDLRFAVHTWSTLAAAVAGFQQHFHCDRLNAYCVLPLHHVSGLMQAMRCLLSGGQLVVQSFKELLQEGAIRSPADNLFLSLVPTQLQRLLQNAETDLDLTRFTAILLGGGPAWPQLRQTARDLQLPLSPTYGMTETAAQIATLLPQEFLDGNLSSGRVSPHAAMTIRDDAGRSLPPGAIGRITISAESLALSYWQSPLPHPFQTGDLGYLDASGYLHVCGRESSVIITGGEKVLPEEVEAVILATEAVQDVSVLGIPDDDWGERVVAVVVEMEETDRDRLMHALRTQLSPYKIPKQWIVCPSLPRNAQGKLNRTALRHWLMQQTTATIGANLASADVAGD